MAGTEKKNSTKFQIINYIINHKATSKVELSRNLNLSMPTVLSNVNELLASGIAVEMGEYESTGGRKAKMISINPAYRYAVGIRITAKHVGFVLVNLKSEIEKYKRILPFPKGFVKSLLYKKHYTPLIPLQDNIFHFFQSFFLFNLFFNCPECKFDRLIIACCQW